jgi:hypothetical protein
MTGNDPPKVNSETLEVSIFGKSRTRRSGSVNLKAVYESSEFASIVIRIFPTRASVEILSTVAIEEKAGSTLGEAV